MEDELRVDLELERRIGTGRIRIVIIRPRFITLSIGLNLLFNKRMTYHSWNAYINIFCVKYIVKFIFNDPIVEKRNIYARGDIEELVQYFNEDD